MKNKGYLILVLCLLLTATACANGKPKNENSMQSSYTGTVVRKAEIKNTAALPYTSFLPEELLNSKAFQEAVTHENAVILYNAEVASAKKTADTFLKQVESNEDAQLLIYRFYESSGTKNASCIVLEVTGGEKFISYKNAAQDAASENTWDADLTDESETYKIKTMSCSKYGVLTIETDGNSEPSYVQVISNYDLFDDYDKKVELANKYVQPIYYPLAVGHTFGSTDEIVDWLPILERIFEIAKEKDEDNFWTKYPDGRISVDEMMGLLHRYFEVETKTVVGKINNAMIDENTVEYLGGLGGAYPDILVTGYAEKGDTTQITCTQRSAVTGDVAEDISFTITVKNMPDGTFRYQSLEKA